jgi:hypothetical protein
MSVTITKLGTDEKTPLPPPPQPTVKKGGGKTMKTYPRGVLKTAKNHHKKSEIKGISDPAKAPPLKKTMRKHTIRLITDKGLRQHKKTLKKKISKMSNEKVRQLVEKHGLLKNPSTPPSIMREMLEGGAIAGFVSLN